MARRRDGGTASGSGGAYAPPTPEITAFIAAIAARHPRELSALTAQVRDALADDDGTGWLAFERVGGTPCNIVLPPGNYFSISLAEADPGWPGPQGVTDIILSFHDDRRIWEIEFVCETDYARMDYAALARWVSQRPPDLGEADDFRFVRIVTDATFEQDVVRSDRLALVHFVMPDAAESRWMEIVVARIAKVMTPRVGFFVVDVAANPDVKRAFHVDGFPYVLFFERGRIVAHMNGFGPNTSAELMATIVRLRANT